MIVVADTSPINYLVLIDHIELLPALFQRVAVPAAVLDELHSPGAPPAVKAWVADPPEWFEVRPVDVEDTTVSPSRRFDAGEREAIALAVRISADAVLVDDWQGRQEAARCRLPVIGTLAVLEMASARGLIDFEISLARMDATNFRF